MKRFPRLWLDLLIKHPTWILYDILVKVDRFIFPDKFVILGCDIDAGLPIIWDRTFLETATALVDFESGELKFRLNDKKFTSKVCKWMKKPSEIHVVLIYDVIEGSMTRVSEMICMDEPLLVVSFGYSTGTRCL